MRPRRAAAAAIGAGLVLLVSGPSWASPAPAARFSPRPAESPGRSRPDHVTGQVLVRFRPGLAARSSEALRDTVDARLVQALPLPGLQLLDLPARTPVRDAIARLERQPGVLYAEPNRYLHFSSVANDARFVQLWGLRNTGQTVLGTAGLAGADISATPAWDTQTGSAAVTVAVVDTGIDYSHPDLAANIWTNPGETGSGKETNHIDDDGNGYVDDWRGWDWEDADNDPNDNVQNQFELFDAGHGTHNAGIIGAQGNNGIGVAGVNWDVSLMPLRVLTTSDELAAFNYAADKGAKVVNFSAGGPQHSQAEEDTINSLAGVLFVVPAGNGGGDGVGDNSDLRGDYPCRLPAANLICVAASTQSDRLARFSNYGLTSVDLAAPGVNSLSTAPPGMISVDLSEDFESPLDGRWTTGGRGRVWRRTNEVAPNLSLADSPHTNYRNNSNTWVRSRPIDLRGRHNCELDYFLLVSTQRHHDHLYVETSSDAVHWRTLRKYSGSRNNVFVDLIPSDLNGDRSIYIRYRLRSDASVRADGAYIDDVGVLCETRGEAYDYGDGTSFATPHVAGAAALLWAQSPSLTVAQVKAKLLTTVDQKPSLLGKLVSGGRLNVAAALAP